MSSAGPDLQIVALGESVRVAGFALAGALVLGAETAEEVRQAWQQVPPDTGLVLLTATAAEALAEQDADAAGARADLLRAVLP